MSLAAGLLLWRLGDGPLRDWDEALYAQVAREMFEGGNWVTLSWNSQPYFKKPPLLFWSVALSYRVFGVSEWATRFPSVLCGVGSVLLVVLLGRQLYGRLAGLGAGLLLLTLYPFLTHGSRQSATDAPLLFCSLLALFCFWSGRRSRAWLVGVGVALGMGLLAKGVAALLPLLIVFLFCLWDRDLTLLRSGFFRVGLIGGMICALPWYLYQVVTHGLPFVRTFLWDETLTRLVITYDAPLRPWYFYLESLWGDLFHCLPLLLGFPLIRFLSWRPRFSFSLSTRFLLCWLGLSLLVVLSAQTQHSWYLLPVYPPLCLLVAGSGLRLGRRLFTAVTVPPTPALFLQRQAFVGILWCFLLSLPGYINQLPQRLVWVEEFYQTRNALLQELSERLDPDVPLYAVGVQMPGVVFYSRHAAVFLAETDFANLLTLQIPIYALVPSPLADRLGKQRLFLVGQKQEWCLFAYLPPLQTRTEEAEPVPQEETTEEL